MTSTREFLSCAETAALLRQALKEAFPGVKFSVKSKTYSGGASISIRWTDGPNEAQVDTIAKRFKGAYFDSTIDYKGAVFHMLDGKPVHFGADYIHTNRDDSKPAIERAIDRVFKRLHGNFREAGIERPTVEQFNRGDLFLVKLPGLHEWGNESVQAEIRKVLAKSSDRLSIAPSKTAARVFVTHDDGYSRQCGAGMSAVSIEA